MTPQQYNEAKAILAGVPDKDLTHFDGNYYWQFTNECGWARYCNPIAKVVAGEPLSNIRSLFDIRQLVEYYEREQKIRNVFNSFANSAMKNCSIS